jgi:carboxylesterase
MAINSPLTIPTAEPFFFPGGPTGVLLVHGFTGSPFEMRNPGEYLASQGHTVLAVRLAGHATQAGDMAHVRWREWLASVEDGLNLLKGSVKRTFIMGLSLGGALALVAASYIPVAGVITMSTPIALPDDPRLRYIRIISKFMPRLPKGAPDWHNPQAAQDHIEYPYTPTIAIAELDDLLKVMRASLPAVKAPVLSVQSHADHSIPPDSMPRIHAALGSQEKQTLWVENSGHNIPREPDRQIVFEAAGQFIKLFSGQDI